ncbi:MAG TPA: TonB-dependent receptor [Terriglobia bacterium]|nr:TonB-dependent receptor [Terriglobia bacterium]
MGKVLIPAAVLLSVCLTANTFSQSSNASVSGTVSDATGALIPGVTVTATNNATGVVTMALSNEAGVYSLPSLLPGVYTLSAELSGFQKQTYTNTQLGNAQQVRLNFSLQVASQAQSVEVTIEADTLIATSSSSVGDVLPEGKVRDLPVVGNNVLDLINTMAGVRITNYDQVFGQDQTTFAGVSARNSNIQRDGVTVDAGGRYPTGIQAATRMNPDLIGEVRMILTPVDAEVGRGNGQIQIQTRSGTNQYHGAGVFSLRNTALDANTWANNRTQPAPPSRDWRSFPEYTGSLGGPIIKNKTFFFALWDGVIARTRSTVNTIVLTPCARNGIFRYYDNWNNGDAQSPTVLGSTPTIAVVDALGNPKAPATNPDGTSHNGILRYASVFGRLTNIPTRPDCSDAVLAGSPWDTNRTGYDTTGYIRKVLNQMPPANAYDSTPVNLQNTVIDGLNTANHRWVRRLHGSNNLFAIGEEIDRNQANVKIDHNFNSNHKISGGWSYDRGTADDAYPTWPGGWGGWNYSRPMVLTTNFTSTLSASLVNEARFGMRRTGSNPVSPIETPGSGDEIKKFIFNYGGIPVWPHMGTTAFGFQNSQPPGGRGTYQITQRDITPLYSYADTVSWIKGKHSFRGGGEFRFARSKAIQNGLDFTATGSIHGTAAGGDSPLAPISATAISAANMAGLAGTTAGGNNQRMRGLLSYLAGSLASVNQVYFINSPDKLTDWEDYRTSPYAIRDFHQNEFAFFFKDDWKVTKSLTLNLGLRYEYFGVPFEANGLTASLVGGGLSAFGVSKDFSGWMTPGERGGLTTFEFVGPNSPNSGKRIYKQDRNNFGPAVGFAWSADERTTLRGGYQITYQGTQRGNDLQSAIGFPPGSIFRAQYTGVTGNEYLDLTDLASSSVFPVPTVANGAVIKPMQQISIRDRSQSIQAYDPNTITPYVQNFTLALTRTITPKLVAEVKYVGTLGLKQYQNMNLNVPNFLFNGLKDAFDAVRAGGESTLLDNMFRGINISGGGAVGTGGQTAGGQLRADARFNSNLANGNYIALANSIATLNYSKAGGLNPGLADIPLGVQGAVLRMNGFAENFILPNPQFAAATSSIGNTGVLYRTNLAHNNYHSMESQLTLRPTAGISLTGTYTWSKNLGNPANGVANNTLGTGGFTNPFDRAGDYGRLTADRTHDFRTNGTFELPFGPGRPLLGNSHGLLARIVEGWETSWIVNLNSGAPLSVGANYTSGTAQQLGLYGNTVPDIVGPFPFKEKGVRWGGVKTTNGLLYGSFWDPSAFTMVGDPQCTSLPTTLRPLCVLTAVADAKTGQVLLQNPRPGTRGNFGQNVIDGPGQWRFDATIGKRFRVGETKSLQLRVDAYNILNHPEPQNPNVSINPVLTGGNANAAFGWITSKTLANNFVGAGTTQRTFQGQLRFQF